jgi:arylsulfatase
MDLDKLPFDPLEYIEHLDELPFERSMDPSIGN